VSSPFCRACGHLLKSVDGCAICQDIKRNLVWPQIEGDHAIQTTLDLSQSVARLLKRQLRRLEKISKSSKDQLSRDDYSRLMELTRGTTGLLQQMRMLEESTAAQAKNLTYEKSCELYINEFFATLPQEHQRGLLQSMTRVYNEQRQPKAVGSE
jgi:hypothetical protein